MKIGVFCAANNNIDPDFFRLTEELGTWMGRQGHSLVYGGGNVGLMMCIGEAVHRAGGTTIGMVPRIMAETHRVYLDLDVDIPCENLADRKELMLAQSDVLVALPGGIGTLDEVFTVAATHTIGYHRKPMVLYNMKGFWNATIAMLDDMEQRGMIRGKWADFIAVANSFEELKTLIENKG